MGIEVLMNLIHTSDIGVARVILRRESDVDAPWIATAVYEDMRVIREAASEPEEALTLLLETVRTSQDLF